jgi:hypothetical protein
VHAAVRWFEKERMAGRSPLAEAVLAQFDVDWFVANVEPLVFANKDSQEALRVKGHELLTLYVKERSDGKRSI